MRALAALIIPLALAVACDLPFSLSSDGARAKLGDEDGDGFLSCASLGVTPGSAVECDCLDTPGHGAAEGVNPALVHPDTAGAPVVERCDALDWDCDGDPHPCPRPSELWPDADGDGYGDGGAETTPFEVCTQCSPDQGFVLNRGDCDDADPQTYSGAPERCDGLDNDCDSKVDEDLPTYVLYLDNDGDGYGAGAGVEGCTRGVEGYSLLNGDCDDDPDGLGPFRHPGSIEECQAGAGDDPIDYNCDGLVSAAADVDGDGFSLCEDCQDGDATIHPGAAELCDGRDGDCDGRVDELAGPMFSDIDGDGYGSNPLDRCPVGGATTATMGGDCDEGDPLKNPGAVEVCDREDNDCDFNVDEDLSTVAWYPDADGDGYGDEGAAAEPGCLGAPLVVGSISYVNDHTDCDDTREDVHPGAQEVCGAGEDRNCDGSADLDGVDRDQDGYDACDDCNDSPCGGYDIHPGAVEVCNDLDDDCDTYIDDVGLLNWYSDSDGDGYYGKGADFSHSTCEPARSGWQSTPGTDCDDRDAAIFPGVGDCTPLPTPTPTATPEACVP